MFGLKEISFKRLVLILNKNNSVLPCLKNRNTKLDCCLHNQTLPHVHLYIQTAWSSFTNLKLADNALCRNATCCQQMVNEEGDLPDWHILEHMDIPSVCRCPKTYGKPEPKIYKGFLCNIKPKKLFCIKNLMPLCCCTWTLTADIKYWCCHCYYFNAS